MESQTEKRIKDTVLEILSNSDMEKVTEYMIRKSASEKLEMDLSEPERKKFVRKVVESYLADQQAKSEAKEADPEVETEGGAEKDEEEKEEEEEGIEYDDQGNPIVCRLSKNRRVSISEFKGMTLVSIREYFLKGDKELPSSKGISLTTEQWAAFKKNVSAIEDTIKKMESRLD